MLVPFFVLSADYADLITNVALRFFVICAICVICGLLFGYHRHMREWHIAGGRKLPIGERTLVMGILNVTPDSFSDGGEFFSLDHAMAHADQMIAEGADIIDVGGESTRPGDAAIVSAEEEMKRVLPVLKALAQRTDIPVSVDTTKSEVATP